MVQIPVGYEILKDGVDSQFVYSFKRADGTKHNEWYTWKMGAIDAMWIDVRERAVKAALPGKSSAERDLLNNAAFAAGYLQGKLFDDTQVRLLMAQHGYTFNPEITALQTVEKLLVMLNGAR